MSGKTRLLLILNALAIFGAGYKLGYLVAGKSLSHDDQIFWVALAFGWVIVFFVENVADAFAEKRRNRRRAARKATS